MIINYEQYTHFMSDILNCNYAVGKTEKGEYVYVWTIHDTEEVTNEMIESPDCLHGAMVGKLEDIVEEIETCVGSFRYHGDEDQQEEAAEIVEDLLSTFGLETQFGTKY